MIDVTPFVMAMFVVDRSPLWVSVTLRSNRHRRRREGRKAQEPGKAR